MYDGVMRRAIVALLVCVACKNVQTVQKCHACFVDDPTTCGDYEGDCYGPYSHSMPASTEDEAKELAAQSACTTRYGGAIPPTGPRPGCAVGISYSAADRAASLTKFAFTCSSYKKKCP
jgi:hypothetical protein